MQVGTRESSAYGALFTLTDWAILRKCSNRIWAAWKRGDLCFALALSRSRKLSLARAVCGSSLLLSITRGDHAAGDLEPPLLGINLGKLAFKVSLIP